MSARSCNRNILRRVRGAGSAGLSCLFGFAQQEEPDRPNKQDKLPWPRRWYLVVREMNVQDRHI
jgi:hypothetical protein